jgi:hypothetical protein
MGNPYNGFTAAERVKKLVDMHRQIASGLLMPPRGPCRLCNDPGCSASTTLDADQGNCRQSSDDATVANQFEYHDEDYNLEYRWVEPFAFVVCRLCHLRIHTRFKHPMAWRCFLAHVRRGGYARELRETQVKWEFVAWRRALGSDAELPLLRQVRPYVEISGSEWFSKLSREPVISSSQPVLNTSVLFK